MKGRRTQSPHSSVLEVTGMHIVFTLALVPAEGGGGESIYIRRAQKIDSSSGVKAPRTMSTDSRG
jgi:hypothetical protein